MIQSLHITNYALINKLEIDFKKGFSIITGETGAGKSILLGALSLILGNRAETSVLKDKSKKCIIETCFNIKDYRFNAFFENNNLDYDNECFVRREILPSGKTRAFINDTPVNLHVLKELGLKLVDIHSQHQSLLLGDRKFQLTVVDGLANHEKLLLNYKNKYFQLKEENKRLSDLQAKAEKNKADLDYLQFQFNQLEELNLNDIDEQDLLESELDALNHSEEIKLGLSRIAEYLNGDQNSALALIKSGYLESNKLQSFFNDATELSKRLESIEIELRDISDEVEKQSELITYNPARIEEINSRLSSIYSLQQKYNVKTIKELIALQNSFDAQILEIESYDEQISKQKQICDELNSKIISLAKKISANRKSVLPKAMKTIVELLQNLGMPFSQFVIKIEETDSINESGKDKISFLFSANKKSPLQEINKVASGGEVSRLMLCIKSLISETNKLPTIIFDEIDSGVSGDIADKVGNIMKDMSKNMQVINITHLPQIAAKGDIHYCVYKDEIKDVTHTQIKILSREERLVELAKMLSGSDVSNAAIENAKVLLKN